MYHIHCNVSFPVQQALTDHKKAKVSNLLNADGNSHGSFEVCGALLT